MAQPSKPLKPFRSEAERTAVKQRDIQIRLTLAVLLITLATALSEYGVL